MNWPDEVMQADWWKPPVGAFLTALHSFPVSRARELGVRPINQTTKLTGKAAAPANWRETLSDFYELTRQQAFPLLSNELQRKLARRFERFLAEERHFAFEPVLVHADLWKDHILLKMQEQQVSGIIDFGDVGIGDPAMDVWPSLLPYYGGQVDETFQTRHAFYRQLFPPLNALLFGQVYDDRELVEEGCQALAVELEEARGAC
jgi:aminoglycoside phosphotransferase (APT) family kinase protein